MGTRREHLLSLAGIDISSKTENELLKIFNQLFEDGMHGLCFSPYLDGQQPGTQLTEEQIRRRLEIIRPHSQWVRSFSCTEGNELIPAIAKESGWSLAWNR